MGVTNGLRPFVWEKLRFSTARGASPKSKVEGGKPDGGMERGFEVARVCGLCRSGEIFGVDKVTSACFAADEPFADEGIEAAVGVASVLADGAGDLADGGSVVVEYGDEDLYLPGGDVDAQAVDDFGDELLFEGGEFFIRKGAQLSFQGGFFFGGERICAMGHRERIAHLCGFVGNWG